LSTAIKLAIGIAATLLVTCLFFGIPGLAQLTLARDADGSKQIVGCLLQKFFTSFAKCITNPKCVTNVLCIHACKNAADKTSCQIKCVDFFFKSKLCENSTSVPSATCPVFLKNRTTDPIPFHPKTSLFHGRWYILTGQYKLLETFPCQVHFFTEAAPGKITGNSMGASKDPMECFSFATPSKNSSKSNKCPRIESSMTMNTCTIKMTGVSSTMVIYRTRW
jgi:hypothetical protein